MKEPLTFTKRARARANRILTTREFALFIDRKKMTNRQPPLNDFVGRCWSSSSKPRPVKELNQFNEYKIHGNLPARSAAAREGPLSASISVNRAWTSANLDDSSSLSSSNRFSSLADSSSTSLVSSNNCSFKRWSRQTSAFNTESMAFVSSPMI